MGYALYKLSKEDAAIFVKLTEKCWNGKERDLTKLNKYERAVLLKLMDKAGEYTPGEKPVKKYNDNHDPKTGRFAPKPDTSYQGKQYGKAYGRGKTADMMADELDKLPVKVVEANTEAIKQIKAVNGNPNAKITIYRATVGDTINEGDWVFLERSLAERWTKTPMGTPKKGCKVLTKEVAAKDVDWTGKNLEFAYAPQGVAKSFASFVRKYNKYHDPKTGRFTSAPGGASAKKPKANVKIRHDVLDCYGEESYCKYTAYDGENVAGYIKYSRVGDGSPYVQYIETAEEYRGQGVATKLLQQMQHDIGDTEINFGYTTPDGTKLLEKITYTVTDKKIQDKFDKLERIKSKLKREEKILDDLWEEFDAAVTPEAQEQVRAKIHVHGDKWNQLYDAIPGIERSLEDLKPTKTYIKMDGFEPVEKSKSFLDTIKKFNPYHDTKTGRFTSAPGGSGIMANIAPEFKADYDKDKLTYEMLGLDPAPLDDKYELLAVLNPGSKVNIGAMPDDLRKQTVATVKQFIDKYPMAKEAITTITVGDNGYTDTFDADYFKAHPKTMAFYNRENGVLCLNPSLYDKKSNRASKFEEVYRETVESGYHPKGTDHTSVIVHEMAHAIDNYYSTVNKANFAAEVKREVSFQASKTKKDFSVNAQKTGLSEYAMVNEAEFFAEAIAEYFCSPSPREIATSVGQTLDRRMANDQRFKRKYENLYEAEKIGGATIYDRRKT